MDGFETLADSGPVQHSLQLTLAVCLGATLGINREKADKPAGLRTHMMVALGACLFTILAFSVALPQDTIHDERTVDPFRIIQGIVGGLGFLGAGSIIKASNPGPGVDVSGLTTAASVWMSGALGAACGMGAYAEAITSAVLGLAILGISRWM